MKKLFALTYEEGFIDDIIHINKLCGEEFECDGDSLHVKVVLETRGEDIK